MIPLIDYDTLKSLNFRVDNSWDGRAELSVLSPALNGYGSPLTYERQDSFGSKICNISLSNPSRSGLSYGTISNIYSNLDPEEAFDSFDRYLIERFLRFGLKPEYFQFPTYQDWYDHWDFDNPIFNPPENFEQLVSKFNNLETRTQKLWEVLLLEYERVLPKVLQIPFWEIRRVDKKDLHINKNNLILSVQQSYQEVNNLESSFSDRVAGLAIGGDTFHLLDGHHRCSVILQQQDHVNLLVPAPYNEYDWEIAKDYCLSRGEDSLEFQILVYETIQSKGSLKG